MAETFSKVTENLDRIELDRITCYAYHGYLSEEARLGQRFELTVEVFLDLSLAADSDELGSTLSYHDLFKTVYAAATGTRFKLIEALGQHIAGLIFTQFQVPAVRIKIRKPNPPIPEYYGSAIVEISRVNTEL
ncbi:MAG: dihydroneopterin aldolase [Candidatus Delongbacteria bacterium]|nr:dihydroneopterin aldolase [Candidatus Delongbacteria bacterium]